MEQSIEQQQQHQRGGEENEIENDNKSPEYGFLERRAIMMSRYPKTYFWIAFIISVVLSFIGFRFGGFKVEPDSSGWNSRGTLLGNRQTQLMLVQANQNYLFYDNNGDAWDDLLNNVQKGWQSSDDDDSDDDDSNDNESGASSRRLQDLRHRESLLLQQHQSENQHLDDNYSYNYTSILHNEELFSSLLDRSLQQQEQEQEQQQQQDEKLDQDSSIMTSSSSSITSSTATNTTRHRRHMSMFSCDWGWYTDGRMTSGSRLWPIWKTNSNTLSALSANVIKDLCIAEENTQRFLQQNGLCYGCANNQCLPPYSIVFYIRLLISGGMNMDCTTLSNSWTPIRQKELEQDWKLCVNELLPDDDDDDDTTSRGKKNNQLPESCDNSLFYTSMIDSMFHQTGNIHYTSSIFATPDTKSDIKELYDNVPNYDRGSASNLIEGAYDTQKNDFGLLLSDRSIGRDMSLAAGSAFISGLAILVHTRSCFLTTVGIIQITLSFPLSYFVYTFFGGLKFFPFLNFIGVFVIFALGADHVFVAVDKWKNARLKYGNRASTEFVAAHALPDAAGAMLLTTSTTAVAFFGTAICPVAPIKLFAIFCGLLITLDYLLDILLIFPCLIIYDQNRYKNNCCLTCNCRNKVEQEQEKVDGGDDNCNHNNHHDNFNHNIKNLEEGNNTKNHDNDDDDDSNNDKQCQKHQQQEDEDDDDDVVDVAKGIHMDDYGDHEDNNNDNKMQEDEKKQSLIHCILSTYYVYLHMFRWPLFIGSLIALLLCGYYASQLALPSSSEVRILGPQIEYEKNFQWRGNLLNEEIKKNSGSKAFIIWGTNPADTGDHNNPATWSQLVLDDEFDLSSIDAQEYMKDFCTDLFEQKFASKISSEYYCPITMLDYWLKMQSLKPYALQDSSYQLHCNNATGVPIPEDTFHPCLVGFSKQYNITTVLSRAGIVKIMYVVFNCRKTFDAPNHELASEWELIENWVNTKQSTAPNGVNKAYFSALMFWWYDTNTQMFKTAIGAAAIAIAAAAIVILISSRSIILTIFSVLSVAFVLSSVTASMASMGWTLGFLESICFAILIGVSVDFVIHFSHAYASIPGDVNRSERTKFALIHMGPSILAAAFTSLAGATIMLFTVITFFQKFAIVLFLTIVESTIGSFVFFLTLTDCIGPSNPTYAVDYIVNMISNKRNQEKENNSNNQHDATIITTEKNNDDSSEKLSDK